MKKVISFCFVAGIIVVVSCTKKASPASSSSDNTVIVTKAETPKMSYTANVKTIIQAKCTPCHIPASGGFKKALDTYDAVKQNIDDIVRRIKLNPEERGFMPFKHAALSKEEIAVFENWRNGGMNEN